MLVLDEAGSAWELDMVDKALLQQAVLQLFYEKVE